MKIDDLKYNSLAGIIKGYEKKGRSESASFLNWFLENIYRLDEVDADDSICDASNDKGVDGIYVDANNEEIHFFQSKVRQKDSGTIGDVDLKNLSASIRQFDTPEKIKSVIEGDANLHLKRLLERKNISGLVEKGYKLRGIYVTNEMHDAASSAYTAQDDSIVVFDRAEIAGNFVEIDKKSGVDGEFYFDVDYVDPMVFKVGDEIATFVFPAKALQLVKLEGISDGTLFTQNVRYSLGNTSINKSIADSAKNKAEHKNFSLFHNGIIVLCEDAKLDEKKLFIKRYAVVNGAQSLTTFYKNKASLTEDLRVLVRVIALQDDAIAKKITEYSNNQNAIKPRDMRSNHDLMTRLQSEFNENSGEYFFEIKRGENIPSGKAIISNDIAGRLLLAFDLAEPYSCHQVYKVFDEKYSEIYGRKEVDYSRVVFLYKILQVVLISMEKIENLAFANYGLTQYFVIYVVGIILRKTDVTKDYVRSPRKVLGSDKEGKFFESLKALLVTLIIDLNYEVKSKGDAFDYKSDFKSPKQSEEWASRLVQSYEKDVARGKAEDFSALK